MKDPISEPVFGGSSSLRGVVVEVGNKLPVPAATILLKVCTELKGSVPHSGFRNWEAVATSDVDGRFNIEGLREQRVLVNVVAPGFVDYLASSTVELHRLISGHHDFLRISTSVALGYWDPSWEEEAEGVKSLAESLMPRIPSGPSHELCIELMKGTEINGVVVDRNGNPIPRGEVLLQSQTITNVHPGGWEQYDIAVDKSGPQIHQGRFKLTVYPQGTVGMCLCAPGFVPECQETEVGGFSINRRYTLSQGTLVAGRVLGSSGSPIEGALVVGLEPLEGGRVVHTTSTSQGAFELFVPESSRIALLAYSPTDGACRAELNELKQPVELRLTQPRRLQGRIVNGAGQGIANIRITQAPRVRLGGDQLLLLELVDLPQAQGRRIKSPSRGVLWLSLPSRERSTRSAPDGGFELLTVLDESDAVVLELGGEGYLRAYLTGYQDLRMENERLSPRPFGSL